MPQRDLVKWGDHIMGYYVDADITTREIFDTDMELWPSYFAN